MRCQPRASAAHSTASALLADVASFGLSTLSQRRAAPKATATYTDAAPAGSQCSQHYAASTATERAIAAAKRECPRGPVLAGLVASSVGWE
jgi:hypothetical protein